jgi:regulatory protein YycH of two-component signal transduction system YycFG
MQCDTHLFTLVQVVQYDMFTITKVAIGISHTNKHFKANVNIIVTAFPNNFGKYDRKWSSYVRFGDSSHCLIKMN